MHDFHKASCEEDWNSNKKYTLHIAYFIPEVYISLPPASRSPVLSLIKESIKQRKCAAD